MTERNDNGSRGELVKLTDVPLDALASEIRNNVEVSEQHFRTAVERAIKAGELLTVAKSRLPHGQWGTWVEENLPFGERMASNYMRLAADRQRVSDLPSVREAIAVLEAPKELRIKATPAPESEPVRVQARVVSQPTSSRHPSRFGWSRRM